MKSDFSQMKLFQKRLELAAREQKQQFFEDCARELAARFLAKVIKRTPVGKGAFEPEVKNGVMKQQRVASGGTLRRGWTAKTEAEATGGSGGGENPLKYAESLKVEKIGSGYQITIINPVSYASYVEYGHRQTPGRFVPAIGKQLVKGWVPGQFMMTISEKELQTAAPGVLKKKFREFLQGVLDGK